MNEFKKWMIEKEEITSLVANSYKLSINKISRHYSQQINKNIDLYEINDISFINDLVREYRTCGKYQDFGNLNNGLHKAAIAAYARFVEDKPKIKEKKSFPSGNPGGTLSDESHKIVERAMKNIKDINRNCKNHNGNPIFKGSVHEYSTEIEDSCTSLSQFKNLTPYLHKIIFKDFILNLYIIIYETTREENKNTTKGKPFYDYKLPYEFTRDGTQTKHFMDIVGTLRHHYAHLEPEYKVSIKKISYGDVLNELLRNRDEPESREDFQKLQIEVLKLFENAMEDLLKIVKKK